MELPGNYESTIIVKGTTFFLSEERSPVHCNLLPSPKGRENQSQSPSVGIGVVFFISLPELQPRDSKFSPGKDRFDGCVFQIKFVHKNSPSKMFFTICTLIIP